MSRSTRPARWSSTTRCSSPPATAPAARCSRCSPDFTHKVVWTTQEFGLHFNTAIYRGGYLYGFDGRNEPDASLACVDAATGKIVWRETPEWTETVGPGGRGRPQLVGTYRGSLLAADGQFLCLGEMGHLLWMNLTPKRLHAGGAGAAVSGARVVDAAGPQPGPVVRRAEHAGPQPDHRSPAAVLRPAGVAARRRDRRVHRRRLVAGADDTSSYGDPAAVPCPSTQDPACGGEDRLTDRRAFPSVSHARRFVDTAARRYTPHDAAHPLDADAGDRRSRRGNSSFDILVRRIAGAVGRAGGRSWPA